MHIRRFVLLVWLLTLASCSDDTNRPQESGPPTFSRMMGGFGSHVYAADVVVTSNGLRVVAGAFGGTLHVTGSSDSLIASGAADVFLAAFREDGTVAWLQHAGGGDIVSAYCVARDASDNIYIAGFHAGNVTFGTTNLTGTGVLVAKMDADGNPLWASGGGASQFDGAYDVTSAADGGVYTCGSVSSETKVLGEDVGEFGSSAGFLVRGQASGVGNWSQSASGTGGAICYGVARSADGTVLVCGYYFGSAVEIGGEILPLDGAQGAFIARFTDNGASAGNIRIGGTGATYAYKLTAVGNESVVAGGFDGTVDFDVNTAAGSVTSAGNQDAFVARYSEDGELLWVKTFGTGDNEFGWAISRIGSNDLLLAGTFNNSLSLGSRVLTSAGSEDFFLARLDGVGSVRSSSQIGGTSDEILLSVTAFGGTSIVVGYTQGGLRFPDGTERAPFGPTNGFIYQE